MTDQINLRQRIEAAWSHKTTFTITDYLFSECYAIGQCGVTALYVQSQLGGKLYEAWLDEAKIKRHFFNCINGVMVDYTYQQFPQYTKLYHPKQVRKRDILANDWFVERYQNFLTALNGNV